MNTSIPREFIDLVLSRIDIVHLIDTHVQLTKKSSNNYFACCPFHQENSPSFSVSQKKQFYYCFGCGAHGNAIDFMMQFDRLSFPEAIESLAKLANLDMPEKTHTPRQSNQALTSLYDFMGTIAAHYYQQMKLSERAIHYLKNRGISGEIAKQFCLGYAPAQWEHLLTHYGNTPANKKRLLDTGLIIHKDATHCYDRFRDRILFPIHDYRGRIIGFGGRILDQGEPKYLNSPETVLFQKGQELYGLYQALKANHKLKRMVIVEGYMDVIALFQYGITYAVATLGTATTTHHLKQLFRYTHEIIFCFDGDQAGKTAAWRALQTSLPLLADHLLIRFLFLPDQEDPDSLIRKQGQHHFEQALDHAQTLSEFFFHTLMKQNDLSSHEGRAKFAHEGLQLISQIPQGLFKQLLLKELEQRTRIELINKEHFTTKTTQYTTPRTTTKPITIANQQKKLSALYLALALLIQNPELAASFITPLPESDSALVQFFNELILLIKQTPTLTTAQLIERFRNHAQEKLIIELINYQHAIPTEGLEQEFLGALRQTTIKMLNKSIESLLTQSANQSLSLAEKKQLSDYIAQKKRLSSTQYP